MSSFRYEDGKEIWDDIVGKQNENDDQQKLRDSAVRIHIGAYKALTKSVQSTAQQRYASFLGAHWKGGGSTSVWRSHLMIMSSNLETLGNQTQKRISDSGAMSVLGVACVSFSTSAIDIDQPDPSLLSWLKQFSDSGTLANNPTVLYAKIGSAQVRGPIRCFEIDASTTGSSQVRMPFLTKRLANEKFHVYDADTSGSTPSLIELVNEVVSETCSCLHTYMHVCGHTCLCSYSLGEGFQNVQCRQDIINYGKLTMQTYIRYVHIQVQVCMYICTYREIHTFTNVHKHSAPLCFPPKETMIGTEKVRYSVRQTPLSNDSFWQCLLFARRPEA